MTYTVLSEDQRALVVNALCDLARNNQRDAVNLPDLAQQFTTQAKNAAQLAEEFERAENITLG